MTHLAMFPVYPQDLYSLPLLVVMYFPANIPESMLNMPSSHGYLYKKPHLDTRISLSGLLTAVLLTIAIRDDLDLLEPLGIYAESILLRSQSPSSAPS